MWSDFWTGVTSPHFDTATNHSGNTWRCCVTTIECGIHYCCAILVLTHVSHMSSGQHTPHGRALHDCINKYENVFTSMNSSSIALHNKSYNNCCYHCKVNRYL